MSEVKQGYAEEFSRRIRQLRIEKFGDQRGARSAASVALNVTAADWRGYELGVLPGAERLAEICRVFDCDANWLLGIQRRDKTLTESQSELLRLLFSTQRLVQHFDRLHTDFLSSLAQAIADPAMAQEQCYQLYSIARGLESVYRQVEQKGGHPPA